MSLPLRPDDPVANSKLGVGRCLTEHRGRVYTLQLRKVFVVIRLRTAKPYAHRFMALVPTPFLRPTRTEAQG